MEMRATLFLTFVGAPCFKGCWLNPHRLEFPSYPRYSGLRSEPSGFTDACTRMKQYAIRPASFLYARGLCKSPGMIIGLTRLHSRSQLLNANTECNT